MDQSSQQKPGDINQDNGEIHQPSEQNPGPIVQNNGKMAPKVFWRSLELPLPTQAQSERALVSVGLAESPC